MNGLLKYLIGGLITVTIFWMAGFIHFFTYVGAPNGKEQKQTDAIIVLTGGPDRINTGLELLASNLAGSLFISGVNRNVTVEKLVSLWRNDIEEAPCCITLGHQATNTTENAYEARQWVDENHVRSATLVTASYHMPRAALEFQHILPDLDIYPHPVSSGKNSIETVFSEYNKTLLTWLRLKLKQQ